MSLADVVGRMSEIATLAERSVSPTQPPPAAATPSAAQTAFRTALAAVTDGTSPLGLPQAAEQYASLLPALGLSTGTSGGRVLGAAESQVGVSEQPPGSNDGPQLAVYRSAVSGASTGEPWCGYFVSWAASQAGVPLGDTGEGLGSVAAITDWAARTGRLLAPSATPSPGDLILFGDRHVGVVESVNADGSLTTVEGNYAQAVARVQRSPAEATGYVRL